MSDVLTRTHAAFAYTFKRALPEAIIALSQTTRPRRSELGYAADFWDQVTEECRASDARKAEQEFATRAWLHFICWLSVNSYAQLILSGVSAKVAGEIYRTKDIQMEIRREALRLTMEVIS